MNILENLKLKALKTVNNASNNPSLRYQLRYEFYQKYGNSIIKDKEGLGNSELAFIDWEIKRGVLNSLDSNAPGSAWWRKVNSHFIYLATLAQLIKESNLHFNNLPAPVTFWLNFINTPNEQTWYRAHNSSIIAGYQEANSLAFNETIYEQYFINIVLYRLLYAQAIVEGVGFGALGKILANPRGLAVSIITDIESFYPSHYPLSKNDIKYVTHKAHNISGHIENFFDNVLILPHLNKLYNEASKWNNSVILTKYLKDDKPCYPITQNDLNN